MNLDEKAGKLEDWRWNQNKVGIAGTGLCPLRNGGLPHRIALSTSGTSCLGNPRCDAKLIAAFFANGAGVAQTVEREPSKLEVAGSTPATRSNDLFHWKYKLSFVAKNTLTDPKLSRYVATESRENLHSGLLGTLREACEKPDTAPPPDMTPVEVEEDLDALARDCLNQYVPERPASLPEPWHEPESGVPAVTDIPWEGYDEMLAANEAYLKRTPVIDRLCYSSAVSMITGGKHAGKSTLARWMAICVLKGNQFLGREVVQGPVLYIASEDETMAARQELIRLGCVRGDPLKFLSASNLDINDQRAFLVRLTTEIARLQAVLVIVDMLFDFIPIHDEMSYAGTREAVGLMQAVASGSGAHIVVIHHAPKNAQIGDAAVAALGSQGLAARVSPIVLVRRFGEGVHSVSSTNVRDPRGEALADSRLMRQPDGSMELGGTFKQYMLAEVYAPRVLEMLEDDPGSEVTGPEVAEALAIAYPVARACLSNMYRNGVVQRSGSGKRGKPFRYYVEIKETNGPPAKKERGTGGGDVPQFQEPDSLPDWESQGRFGYKEK